MFALNSIDKGDFLQDHDLIYKAFNSNKHTLKKSCSSNHCQCLPGKKKKHEVINILVEFLILTLSVTHLPEVLVKPEVCFL